VTELVHTSSLPEKIEFSKALAASKLLPPDYRGNPANILFALEYAEALGVKPIHAITSIHVISGKPAASADLIAAMVRRAGHKLRVTSDDAQATATLTRSDDPDFEFSATWDMKKATAAGLLSNPSWKKYPAAMLRSRAITEVARQGASDTLFGVQYTPEELGAVVNEQGSPVARNIRGGAVTVRPRITAADILDDTMDADIVDPDAEAAAEFMQETP
jgi:hypothetical protein